jgi:hypothetical protein
MTPQDLATVRSLLQALLHTAAALDQILNPAADTDAPEPVKKPGPAWLGKDDEPTPQEVPDGQ